MRKDKYNIVFVTRDETKVKQLQFSLTKLLTYFFVFLFAFLVIGIYSVDSLIDFRYDNKVKSLQKNNKFLQSKLLEMGTKIQNLNKQMSVIENKDDDVRLIMGVPELGDDVREVGIGGTNFDYNLSDNILNAKTAEKLNNQLVMIDKLDREVKLELKSYNDLIATYQAKEDSIRHMPALHPVLDGRITSAFGMRLHPIYKKYRNHPGVDFAAKVGTPIYAAADGVIKLANYNGGYGNCVFIDHLFGYETRYGHMQKILVRKGQRIKRGDKIGLVGKTGIATAPHLHFEVHFRGEEVNPTHYFFDDASLNQAVVESQQ